MLCFSMATTAQDTVVIEDVKVVNYLVKQDLFTIPAAAAVIDSIQLRIQQFNSPVTVLNTVPGVRMEERSPGSYRLSIRGSLLRSPFGIRNVKIYIDEFPLTDAGGNTYLNAIPFDGLARIDILKGPDGSLFGANSGGVVNVVSVKNKNNISASAEAGSFGLFRQHLSFTHVAEKNDISVTENYYSNNGYRDNSRIKRFYLQVNNNWRYAGNNALKLLFFRSDLHYQTPGGLTMEQFQKDPRQSRPATTVLPGAAAQKAAVYNTMLFGGLTHTAQLTPGIKNVLSVSGSSVDFTNPFITNYETRKEQTAGARTYFIFSGHKAATTNWEYNIGAEWQQTNATIHNYENKSGNKGALLAAGKIATNQYFIFNRVRAKLSKRLVAEAGLSVNFYQYHFSDSLDLTRTFRPKWMPRLAISYTCNDVIVLRSSFSNGYSTPTTAEIRPSDNRLNTSLQAETGNNMEAGMRFFSLNKKIWMDLSLYHYRLSGSIVQQQDSSGNEFFVNAGSTRQTGAELQSSFLLIAPWQNRNIRKLSLSNSSTWAHYTFGDYSTAGGNYSGNFVTGVPEFISVSNLLLELKNGFFIFLQHQYTGALPLNDANTISAASFNLVQVKTGIDMNLGKHWKCRLTATADNLLNTTYSLGNDLNAAGGRYYNAAAARNFSLGIALSK